MAVKLVLMYPRPNDIDAFEYIYKNEHVPMALEILRGKTKIVATKILSSPFGTPAFQRVAEVYFSSPKSPGAMFSIRGQKLTIGHALSISSGGTPPSLSPRKRRSCSSKPGMVPVDLPYARNWNNRGSRKFDMSEVS